MLREYHDREWGVPERDGRKLWEKLMLDAFQAGLSWLIVLRKRDALRRSFHGFEPARVARMGSVEVRRLLSDPEIIRSRAKIQAVIAGAKAVRAMEEDGVAFSDFAWGFVGGRPLARRGPVPSKTPLSETISRELKERGFRFVGPTIVYAWMQATGLVNDHDPTCFRRAEVEALARRRPGGR